MEQFHWEKFKQEREEAQEWMIHAERDGIKKAIEDSTLNINSSYKSERAEGYEPDVECPEALERAILDVIASEPRIVGAAFQILVRREQEAKQQLLQALTDNKGQVPSLIETNGDSSLLDGSTGNVLRLES